MSDDKKQQANFFQNIIKDRKSLFILGIIFGLVIFASFRLLSYSPEITHYHANFKIVVNDETVKFESFADFEEVASCSVDDVGGPRHASHMHNYEDDVVHVHEAGVSWGGFLQTVDVTVSKNHLQVKDDLYTANDINKIIIVVDGNIVPSISNSTIKDESRVLIYYGDANKDDVLSIYETVASSASELNNTADPLACSGEEGSSISDRFKNIFN